MINPLNFISRFIKSNNQKELERLYKIVKKVNDLENQAHKLESSEFPKKNSRIKK